MASTKDLESAQLRTDTQGRLPVVGFTLEPIPESVLRAFPQLKEWETKTNARIAEYVKKLNTVQQQI